MKLQSVCLLLGAGMISLMFSITGCKKKSGDVDPVPAKTVVSNWTGIFTGTTVDGNVKLTLYSDETLQGSWTAEDSSFTFHYTGDYTLADTAFEFHSAGTARYYSISSPFTLAGSGYLNSSYGHGTYAIDFSDNSFFEDQSGDWLLTRSK